MNRIQGSRIVGHVTLYVRGKNPERFFDYCAKNGIPVWNIQKRRTDLCVGTVYWHHLKQVELIKERHPYQLTILQPRGLAYYVLNFWQKKEFVIALLLSIGLLFVLSNIVWKLDVTGVTKEIDQKIREGLASFGLYEGAWAYGLEDLDQIQHDLLHEIPELLYIGIHKNGTTFRVDAVEKLIEKEESPLPPQNLVASKNGVIQKVFIKNGIATIAVHDVVKKGDLLVSGMIGIEDGQIVEEKQGEEENDKEEEEEEDGVNRTLVAAEGEVYANTWYEVSVASTLYPRAERLTGNQKTIYSLHVKWFDIPLWGFKRMGSASFFEETEDLKMALLGYTFPLTIHKKTLYELKHSARTRTYKEARQIAIDHVMDDLMLKLGSEAEIMKYNILHEAEENGKVKMKLYISVLENIAKAKKIK